MWKHFDTRSETLAVVPMRTCDSGGTYPPSSEGGVTRTFGCEQAYDAEPGAAPTGGITQTIYHSSNADTVTYCDSNTKGPNGENWVAFYFGEAVDLALVEVINRGEALGGRLSEHEVWYCTNGATVEADCNWVRCSNYGGATTDLQVIEHTCEAQGATAFKLSKPCGVDQYSNNVLNVQEAKAFRPLYPAELKPHFSLTEHVSLNCGGASAGTLAALTFADGDSVKVLGDYERCAYACMAIPGCNGFVFADLTGDATEGNCYPRTLASPFDPIMCSTDSRASTYEMVRDGTDEAVCLPDDGGLAGVRCCSADGSSAISVCDADACFPKWGHASGTVPASSIACPAHATFAEAETECAAQNLRLCTAHELYYPGCFSGCGYDSVRIWTSEDCSPPPPSPPTAPPSPHVPQDVGIGDDLAPHGGFEIWYSDASAFFGTKARTVLTGQQERTSVYAFDPTERGDYARGRYVTLRIYHPHKRLRLETMEVFGDDPTHWQPALRAAGSLRRRQMPPRRTAPADPAPPTRAAIRAPTRASTPPPDAARPSRRTPSRRPTSETAQGDPANDLDAWWNNLELSRREGELYARRAACRARTGAAPPRASPWPSRSPTPASQRAGRAGGDPRRPVPRAGRLRAGRLVDLDPRALGRATSTRTRAIPSTCRSTTRAGRCSCSRARSSPRCTP